MPDPSIEVRAAATVWYGASVHDRRHERCPQTGDRGVERPPRTSDPGGVWRNARGQVSWLADVPDQQPRSRRIGERGRLHSLLPTSPKRRSDGCFTAVAHGSAYSCGYSPRLFEGRIANSECGMESFPFVIRTSPIANRITGVPFSSSPARPGEEPAACMCDVPAM